MLKDDFYQVQNLQGEGESYSAEIIFNPDHAIFKGHFPEQPVVPGVCMVQITTETAEDIVGKRLQLTQSKVIKFLQMIDPGVHPKVVLSLTIKEIPDHSGRSITSKLSFEDTIFFKFRGTFDEFQTDISTAI